MVKSKVIRFKQIKNKVYWDPKEMPLLTALHEYLRYYDYAYIYTIIDKDGHVDRRAMIDKNGEFMSFSLFLNNGFTKETITHSRFKDIWYLSSYLKTQIKWGEKLKLNYFIERSIIL